MAENEFSSATSNRFVDTTVASGTTTKVGKSVVGIKSELERRKKRQGSLVGGGATRSDLANQSFDQRKPLANDSLVIMKDACHPSAGRKIVERRDHLDNNYMLSETKSKFSKPSQRNLGYQ
mmetsp:Transcript_12833/g.19865  ORF Transcript_12833/g.19865 Transcript_12833/m.19865 type:complete len:121 (-) Transcript_12833:4634-4996(-)